MENWKKWKEKINEELRNKTFTDRNNYLKKKYNKALKEIKDEVKFSDLKPIKITSNKNKKTA